MFNTQSGNAGASELIPAGVLSNAVIIVKEVKNSQKTGGRYLNLELALNGGEYHNRRIFTMVSDPWDSRVSEAGKNMAIGALTRMFEACGIFDHEKPETYNLFPTDDDPQNPGANLLHVAENLQGRTIQIQVGISKGKDGYADKNDVKEYLSPNPTSSGFKNWKSFKEGVTSVGKTGPAQTAQTPAAPRPFGGGAVSATPAATGLSTPAFLRKS